MYEKARYWNSLCAPVPIRAKTEESFFAKCFAAKAEFAAVLNAVSSVISVNINGSPVAVTESCPVAITVILFCSGFFG